MLVPTADSAVPIAVLVLAWDETTPAVRALVDATQAPNPSIASILVMVPQAAAPEVLSAEEYLPLNADQLPSSLATEPPAAAPSALPLNLAASPEQLSELPAGSDDELPTLAAPEVISPLPTAIPASLSWSAVRVIGLGNLRLPELARRAGQPLPAPIWLGPPTAPATPYLGATINADLIAVKPLPATVLPGPDRISGLNTTAILSSPTPPLPSYEPAEPLAEAASAEGDLSPLKAVELANFERSSADLLANFEAPSSSDVDTQPSDWAEALAALGQSSVNEPTTHLPTLLAEGAAGRPAAAATPQYAEPNLNFKIIQYARFAVPLVLAEEPYAAIYAPAWPTWLAAQELRQRTGWPLVLHVTDLAAGADEPLDTATSWMAELQRQALRRADVILTETTALAQRLRHELSLPAGTVRAVPAADTVAISQALQTARPRPAASLR